MLTSLFLLVLGFAFLIKGADWLVEGASALAKRLGISDLAIGLTIVAFGTSMPELMVNLVASIQGDAAIAIGNVVGSNIANILFILGCSAALAPVVVHRSTVLKEIPFSLLAVAMLLVMANDMIVDGYARSELSRSDGLALIGFFIIFVAYTMNLPRTDKGETPTARNSTLASSGQIVIGLVALVTGGKLAVDSAVIIAGLLGVSEVLIGLTVVALGTSLPELVTSVVAALKKKADIAVGNIVGSNIFNIFWVLGISAAIRPIPFLPAADLDLFVLALATIILFFVIHNGWIGRRLFLWWRQRELYVIRRWEGLLMLATYAVYITYISWRG